MQMWCNGSIMDFQFIGEGSNPFICFYMGRSSNRSRIGDFQSPDASSSLARSILKFYMGGSNKGEFVGLSSQKCWVQVPHLLLICRYGVMVT